MVNYPNYRDLFTTTLLCSEWFSTMGFITIKPPFGIICLELFSSILSNFKWFWIKKYWPFDPQKWFQMAFLESVVPPQIHQAFILGPWFFTWLEHGTLGPQQKIHFSILKSWTSHDFDMYTPGKLTWHHELILGRSLGFRGGKAWIEKKSIPTWKMAWKWSGQIGAFNFQPNKLSRCPGLPVISPEVNGVWMVCFWGPVIPNLTFGDLEAYGRGLVR